MDMTCWPQCSGKRRTVILQKARPFGDCMFEFKIAYLEAGWFEVEISNGIDEAYITNSDLHGNDAPNILLRNLNELSAMESGTRWLCWHDEPGGYIWTLRKVNDDIYYTVSVALKDSDKLDYEGTRLQKEKIREVMIDSKISFRTMLESIVNSLEPYSFGKNLEVYQKEWGDFPIDEFQEAKKFLSMI